jgi:hypothetical protein
VVLLWSPLSGRRNELADKRSVSYGSGMHVYEVRPRRDRRGFDLISDALPFGHLWYGEPNAVSNAIGFGKFNSGSHDALVLNAPVAT